MTVFDDEILSLAEAVIRRCRSAGIMVATVESCTGGLVSAALTSVAGSSAVFERGFGTYSNEAKSELVGVPASLIETHGAVSAEVALAMAEGGVAASNAGVAVSITGIAGPGGGSAEKPVGLVHFACARENHETAAYHTVFDGNRDDIRRQSVIQALRMITEAVTGQP